MRATAPQTGSFARGRARARSPEWRYMKNVSGRSAPRGGLGMIVGFDDAARVEKFAPARPGFLGVCITAGEIAAGEVGPVWVSGKHLVYAPNCAGIYPGHRFTGDGQFGPLGYFYGPHFGVFLVSSVIYNGETSGDGYPMADWLVAEILSDNGCDVTFVGGDITNGYKAMSLTTLIFGSEFNLNDWSPGYQMIAKVS